MISSKTESRLYICEGDQIIASEIREDIGKKISEISTSGISVLSTDNAVTGWKLYDYYSMREFSRLISHQTTLMMVMTVGFLIEGSIAVCLIFKPIFLQVKQIESAMIEVEKEISRFVFPAIPNFRARWLRLSADLTRWWRRQGI